jgi:hypothetical protein
VKRITAEDGSRYQKLLYVVAAKRRRETTADVSIK